MFFQAESNFLSSVYRLQKLQHPFLNQNVDAHIRRIIGAKCQRRMATEVWQTTKTKGKNLEECGLEKWT